jgi:hypothetical protein
MPGQHGHHVVYSKIRTPYEKIPGGRFIWHGNHTARSTQLPGISNMTPVGQSDAQAHAMLVFLSSLQGRSYGFVE